MTWTTFPPAGGKVRAGVAAMLWGETRSVTSRLSSDTSAVTNNTLVSSGMSVPVRTSATYAMELVVPYNGLSAAADLKIAFVYPTGATAVIAPFGVTTADAAYNVGTVGTEATNYTFGTAAAADRTAMLLGTWVIGSVAGSITVWWAQNTTTAVNSVLRAGAYLTLRPVE